MKGFIVVLAAIVLSVLAIFSVDAGLYTSYALLGIAVIAAIVLPLLNAGNSPGALKKGLIFVEGMIGLFGIFYGSACSEFKADQMN